MAAQTESLRKRTKSSSFWEGFDSAFSAFPSAVDYSAMLHPRDRRAPFLDGLRRDQANLKRDAARAWKILNDGQALANR